MSALQKTRYMQRIEDRRMKKSLLVLAFICNILLLSGCELHWGGATYDVPWWVCLLVPLPIVIFSTVLFIVNMPKNFWARCSKCYGHFWVKKRVVRFAASHSPEDSFEFVTKCPYCKKRTLCQKSYDQDGE